MNKTGKGMCWCGDWGCNWPSHCDCACHSPGQSGLDYIAPMLRGPAPHWKELFEAAFDYGKYDDLRGDPCEHCKPADSADFIRARGRLADAVDRIIDMRA